MKKPKNIPYRLNEQEHRELKMFCALHGFSMQDFVFRAVEEFKKKWGA